MTSGGAGDEAAAAVVAAAGGRGLRLPVVYRRSELFQALFSADHGAVTAILPSAALRPLRLGRGRCVYTVTVLRHHEAVVGDGAGGVHLVRPYGEMVLGPAVTDRWLPPGAPLVVPGPPPASVGVFVAHMPVTTREARDLGRGLWGFAKFVADMRFSDGPSSRSARLAENGAEILSVEVAVRGSVRLEHGASTLYSTLDGRLLRTRCPTIAIVRRSMRGHGRLTLGGHPIADELRRLDLRERPYATQTSVWQQLLLPAGADAGAASGYEGHRGLDRELGRYLVEANGADVDLYQEMPAVSPVSGLWSAEAPGR